jgi:hypothetical protein
MGDVTLPREVRVAVAEYGAACQDLGSPGATVAHHARVGHRRDALNHAIASALQAAEQRGRADAAWYLEERAAAHDRRGRVGRSSAALLRREAAKVRALPSTRSEGGGT